MLRTNSTSIKVEALSQVAVVVNDLQRVIQNYWKTLGIGPWDTLVHEMPHTYDMKYHGKPAEMRSTIGLVQVGDFGFELMQNLEGKSSYTDFLEKHGEGIHHLQYIVDNREIVSEHIEILSRYGFISESSALVGDDGFFAYVNAMKDLKAVFEPIKYPGSTKHKITTYPADKSEKSPAKVKVKAISRVGIVVKNLEAVMQSYWSMLGVGPWDVYEARSPLLHEQVYLGKPCGSTYRFALTKLGPVSLELIQPVSGRDAYSDFLARHGERLHYIGFAVDDLGKTTHLMNESGYPTLMSVGFGNAAFAYYETTDALKCIWGAFQEPGRMPLPDKCYPY